MKHKIPFPGFTLGETWTKLKRSFFSKLKNAKAKLDSKDLRIAALKKQLVEQRDEADRRLGERDSEIAALKAKAGHNVGSKEQLALESNDLRNAALERQLEGQRDQAARRLQDKDSEITALKVKLEHNVSSKE
jgi:regulator of replication initiation timing